MKFKRLISTVTATVIITSVFSSFTFTAAAEGNIYTCDFTQLVKNGEDTIYGKEGDIYRLDENTKVYLTYEGTYVGADGKVYLCGGTAVNGAGKYKKGSYIAFTAPSDGTVSVKGNRIGYCVGNEETDSYKGYNNAFTYDLNEGEMIFLGQRGSTYVSELTFNAAEKSEPTAKPTAPPSIDDSAEHEVLYSENFETYSDGENGGWTSPAGSLEVKTDSNSAINKYITVTSGKNGTARSGYKEIPKITDNFILEADIKTNAYASNVSAFEVLEQKSSLYMNHGCYSNGKYILKMNRPAGLNCFVINNPVSDSGLSLERYEQPAVLTDEIPNGWVHVKAIGNFSDRTVTAYVTSLDGAKVYYHGRTDMSSDVSSFKLLTLLAPSKGVDTCIDNIKITKAGDYSEVFHKAVINDGINEFSQYVYDGESVVNIPDMSIYGSYFLGWNVDGELKSSEELSSFAIAKDTTITASISVDYIENMASVEFNAFPAANQLVMGGDGDTYADNEISLTIMGERGTSIVSNPDSRVKDYKIDWKFDGFRIMDGKPTGESGVFPGTQLYCDSYGRVTVEKTAQSSVNFELKNTSANYYGLVTAEVTYNGKTITVSEPLVLLADASQSSDILLPKNGYASDCNKYDDALIGYRVTANDILTGGWSTSGSDGTYIYLKSDLTGKYFDISRAMNGNSSYTYQQIGNITSQTVFSQDVRYGLNATIAYGNGKDSTSFASTAFELEFASSVFRLNKKEIYTGEKNKWYHIEVIAEPTTKLCMAKIYDIEADGDYTDSMPLAQSEAISFADGYTSGNYYRIMLSKERGSLNINNVTIAKSNIDEKTVSVIYPQTVTIPENGTVTADLSVTAKMADGNAAMGAASWEIADEFSDGVMIQASGSRSAVLTITDKASSGYLPIKVTINGYSVNKSIKLVGGNDNVSFTNAPTGVRIPENGSSEYKYTAEVIDGNAEAIEERNITYKLYDANNEKELSTEGIELKSDGTLTVFSSAKPQCVSIRAISENAEKIEISRAVKVSVYNNKFTFGADVSNYTTVTAADKYNDNRGYGIVGTALDSNGKITGTDFGFKVKLENGNVYNITAVYKGTVKCERIDSYLDGFERVKSTLESDTYQTAVFGDGIFDITFSGSGELSSLVIEKVDRKANTKPSWWTIGDSTIQQNGSWAYTIASDSTTDLSKYPTLASSVSSFHNSGRAGRQHRSYYAEGLMNNLLCGIKPGDIVSISGMGTNDSSSDKEDFKRYNNQYIDAIEDMGGKVILGSYTPTGNYGVTAGKVYDADNIIFKGMRTDAYDTAIREVYRERTDDDNIIGFIDIGQISDNLMTNDVRAEYNKAAAEGKTIGEARAAAQAKADEMMSWWKDYNHYYSTFSSYILPEITARAAQLISGGKQAELPEIVKLAEVNSDDDPTPEPPAVSGNTIKVLSKIADGKNINIKIDDGFSGIAVAAMYNADGELNEIFFETDNSAEKEFKFKQPSEHGGNIIKLMNWNSLSEMKAYGEAIAVDTNELIDGSSVEITSSEEYIDVTALKMYDNNSYRMYTKNGYVDVTADGGRVHNTSGGEVTVVPVYRFAFTNTSNSDEYIKEYVKVGVNSYTEERGYGLIDAEYGINENGCKPVSGKPIKVDVPNGFYDITVYRKGGVRADLYNNGVQIANNTTSSGSQNRPSGYAVMESPRMMVTDGINLTFGNTQGSNERIASVEIARVPEKYKKPVIWVAGDSESANYYPIDEDGNDLDSSKIMMTGFGMQLNKFLPEDYAIANYGQPSATVKTWYNECFESINMLMQKGDTILIDFGINEVASSSNRIDTDEMKQYMQTIIEAAKSKGVTPILISPVYNGKYQHKAYFTYSAASKENAMTAFADEMGIECIDLNKYTQLYVNEAAAATGDESWRANNYHVNDNLHLTQHSALLAASFIAAEMKQMGYAVTDYAYTYKDISSVNSEGFLRGAESGITREYSVAKAEEFIIANTEAEPISVKKWDFATDQTAVSGDNVPVVSGNAIYDMTNENIKFDANSKTTGTTAITLNPAIQNNVSIDFDLKVGALGGQYFEYNITDSEGNNLVSCRFDKYNSKGTLTIGSTVAATDVEFVGEILSSRGDGMTSETTSFANEVNFDKDEVTVTIGSKTIVGKLSGAETGAVEKVEFIGSRSKTADRSIYLDNISIKEYKSSGVSSGETAFAKFRADMYVSSDKTNVPYRYYLPEGYNDESAYPTVIFLHGATRKGSDNENQMYNAKYLFDLIIENESPCILIAPQNAKSWTENTDTTNEFVESLSEKFNVNADKVYLAGYGDGADGCYKLMKSGKYAAMIAISGSGDTADAAAIAKTNAGVMIVNGSDDENSSSAKAMSAALIKAGSKNTEYVEVYGEGSGIIETAATDKSSLSWLFSKSLASNLEQTQKIVDLAIFMGQSNMAGRGKYSDATLVPVGHGYEFRSVTQPNMLFNITGPFGKLENNSAVNDNSGSGVDRRSGDMVSSIMESYYNKTGVPIVGVQCSRGGTNTSYWNGASVKAEAQARLTAAKTYLEENGYEINHIFMVWCQGESDGDKIYSGSQSVEGYKSATLTVFNYMKTVGVTDMFIVQTGHYNGSDSSAEKHDEAYVSINEAQAALAAENNNIYTVASLLGYKENMIDNYHFNQTAYNAVGTAAGAAIADVYTK